MSEPRYDTEALQEARAVTRCPPLMRFHITVTDEHEILILENDDLGDWFVGLIGLPLMAQVGTASRLSREQGREVRPAFHAGWWHTTVDDRGVRHFEGALPPVAAHAMLAWARGELEQYWRVVTQC